MVNRWVGGFALAVLIGSILYVETSSPQSQALGVNAPAMLAAALAPGAVKSSIEANKQCPPQTATERYSSKQPKYPNKYRISAYPKDGFIMITNLYGKSCSEQNAELRIYIRSECAGPASCRALEYQGEKEGEDTWHKVEEKCSTLSVLLTGGCGGAEAGYDPKANLSATTPVIEPAAPATAPIQSAPTNQNGEVINAFKPPQSGSATGQQTAQQTPSAYAQIQPYGNPGNTGSGAVGQAQTGFSGQGGAAPINGPAFEQGSFYRPGYTSPTGGQLPLNYAPGYTTPMMPGLQTTFGAFGNIGGSSNSRTSTAPPTGSYTSGIASLVGGLFSVPAANVAAYIQSFTGTGPRATPANQNSARSRYSSDGQVTVVLPYPMPTGPLPPPPSTTDIYAVFRSIAAEKDGALGESVSADAREDGVSAAFSEVERAFLQDERTGTTPPAAVADKAARKDGASTSYLEPIVVEIGVPVDITDLATYESILAYINGGWAQVRRTAFQNKAALAQAESERESIVAHIGALQEAREAGICDTTCTSALSALQRDLPQWQSRVSALQTAVLNDAAPRPASPPPTVAQMGRVAENLTEPTYQASIPRSAAAAPSTVSVAAQEAVPEVTQSKSEAIVTRVVRSVWNFLKSWFLPPTQGSEKPRASCSLFASLFGRCK